MLHDGVYIRNLGVKVTEAESRTAVPRAGEGRAGGLPVRGLQFRRVDSRDLP